MATMNATDHECKICPAGAYFCEKSTILLESGYWRTNNYTDVIFTCDLCPSCCMGSYEGSRKYCKEGYVGPFCRFCDTQANVWNTNYYRDGRLIINSIYNLLGFGECKSCIEDEGFHIFWMIINIIVLTIYIFFSVQ